MRGGEQPSIGRPEFPGLVAVTFVEDIGVGGGENAADILFNEVFRVGVKIVVSDTVPNGPVRARP
jgi:hypothetical protein